MTELKINKMVGELRRGLYGEMQNPHPRGKDLLGLAIAKQKIATPYAQFDRRRHGEAMNYDIYDCTPTGSAVIVQQRWATVTKYGTSTTKNYFYLRRQGRGVIVEDFDLHKARIVKLAKVATIWGEVIEVLIAKQQRLLRMSAGHQELTAA